MEMDNAGLSVGSGVIYDEKAAVYYFNYGDKGNNWLSFDDSVTFQKKIDLANDRGLGGIFVWALDQDDDNMHALKAVLGKNIVSTPLTQDGYGAFDLNKCYVTDCGKKCKSGDTTMTHLNQKNNKGCAEDSDDEHTWAGKSHTQRSCLFYRFLKMPKVLLTEVSRSLLSCSYSTRFVYVPLERRN